MNKKQKMKKKILIVIVLSLLFNNKVSSQITFKNNNETKNNLKKYLWSRIQSTQDYTDKNGKIDPFITVIDDSKNGYLKVSGEYPPCGCPISETVAAFKDIKGNYTLLEKETKACNWKHQLSSNKALVAIFPENFGITTFIPTLKDTFTEQALFYLEVEIPRFGTEIKTRVKLIPYGMTIKSENLLIYKFSEEEKNAHLKELKKLKKLFLKLSNEAIEQIYQNNCKNLSKNDLKILKQYKLKNKDNSIKNLQIELIKLRKIYNLYSNIHYKSITLDWNKTTAKFYIKEKQNTKKTITFFQFLRSDILKYWEAMC